MKRLLSGTLLLLLTLLLNGQGEVGSWQDHLSYSSSFYLSAGGNKVYSSAGASLLVYDNQSRTISSLSRVSGLNETLISATGWCEEEQTLVIVYKNTGVDLVRKGVITNIPDIKNKYIPGLKEIYNITVTGDRALLAGSFGIVVIDVEGRYVADTWRPGPDGDNNAVYETAIVGDQLYAATAKGVYHATVSQTGLSYYGSWSRLEELSDPGAGYNMAASAENALFICRPGESSASDTVFRFLPGQPATVILTAEGGTIRSIDRAENNLCVTLPSAIRMFSSDGNALREITSYGWAGANPVQTLFYNNTLWIADISHGLVATGNFNNFSNYTITGPYTNNVADIHFAGNSLLITGGTVDNAWGNVYRPFQVFTRTAETWNSYILYDSSDRDAMRVMADPEETDHFFVSAWGNGIYEFRGGAIVNNYNQFNSPLASINPGENYSRICGLAFDRWGNLWMTQSGVPGNLKALKKDGTWLITTLNLNVPVVGDMLIDRNDYVWALLPRGHGLLIYDFAGTPDNTADDRYTVLQVEDTEGHVLNNVFSIIEDRDGNIWVGTDMGPVVYYNPSKVFSSDLKAARIRIPRNDGSGLADYLLGTETINTIAVDGANRKWFGTISSGAYLTSEDGKEELLHFNSTNSPMLSENIVKINVDGRSGEVWFGTAEGILSYRGDATAGREDYSAMYVFPNPVREDYEGVVTVTGLVEGSSVKITDISGNLVYETTSLGGQAAWDLRNYHSERVATGVYLIFCSNEDGTLTEVTKLLVIR